MAGVMEIGRGLAVWVSDRAVLGSSTSLGRSFLRNEARSRPRAVLYRDLGVRSARAEIGAANGATSTGLQSREYKIGETKLTSNGRRKTKIVCTIGPSTNTREMIWKLAEAGMNVARLNMSHGTYYAYATQNQEKEP